MRLFALFATLLFWLFFGLFLVMGLMFLMEGRTKAGLGGLFMAVLLLPAIWEPEPKPKPREPREPTEVPAQRGQQSPPAGTWVDRLRSDPGRFYKINFLVALVLLALVFLLPD